VGALKQPLILHGDHQCDEYGSDGDNAKQRRTPFAVLIARFG
jgi:hypothetical protein